MVNAVRQVVSGQLGRVINSGLSAVKSGLLGNKGGSSAPGGATQSRGKYTTNVLQYPMGVDNDPQQGHYILFNINVNKQPKLKKSKTPAMNKINDRIKREYNLKEAFTKLSNQGIDEGTGIAFTMPATTGIKSQGSTAASQKPAVLGNKHDSKYAKMMEGSTRLATSIALYMPPSVQTSYSPQYTDVEVGGIAEGLTAVKDMVMAIASGGKVTDAMVQRGTEGAEQAVKKGAANVMDAFAPGIRALAQIDAGKIISNKMELSFEGVGRREFSYTFNFLPKSEQEAKVVDEIVNMFKFHSMPEFEGMTGRTMTIPDTFDIEYMYRGSRNNFLNKISTCFCTGVQVAYGGDRYIAYETTSGVHGDGNPPQKTALTLNFKEMEIITRERINEGY